MIPIVIIDERKGMLWNHRRQSQDRLLRKKIMQVIQGKKLWMNPYTWTQFAPEYAAANSIEVDEDFMEKAGEEEYCLIEDKHLRVYSDSIQALLLFRWDRKYPADFFLDLALDDGTWKCIKTEEFSGFSHKKITMEVYQHE